MEDREDTPLASEPWDENDECYEDDDWDLRRDLDDDLGE